MNSAKRIEFLSHAEELVLFRRWRATRDSKALGKVMETMLPLLKKVARPFRYGEAELEELISAGYLGLVEAANRFDPERGFRFSTYALVWAKGAMQLVATRKLNTESFEEEQGIGIETIGEDEAIALSDRSRLSNVLSEAISQLNEREQRIVTGRFLQDDCLSLADFQPTLGVSKERARQLEAAALMRLKKAFVRRGICREMLFEN